MQEIKMDKRFEPCCLTLAHPLAAGVRGVLTMMKRNLFAILLCLFVLACPVLAWSATYYFDSVDGNDSTGVANNANYPYQSITKLDSLFTNGTIQSGDVISFERGTSQYQQVFQGIV